MSTPEGVELIEWVRCGIDLLAETPLDHDERERRIACLEADVRELSAAAAKEEIPGAALVLEEFRHLRLGLK